MIAQMRFALVISLLLVASRASAIVIMEPPIVRACPRPMPWSALSGCLAKRGFGVTVVRALDSAKLVRIDEPNGKGGRTEIAFVLYARQGELWNLAGLYETSGGVYEVLDLQPLVIRKTTGYRIDFGETGPFTVSFDGVTTTDAVRSAHRELFCSSTGFTYHCAQMTTACDLFVRGAARWSFRGELELVGSEMKVTGDRSLVGQCDVPERAFLTWP